MRSNAKMRVGLVATRCYPDLGGIESHVENVLPRLNGPDWDIDVVVTDVTGRLDKTEERYGAPVRRYRAFPANRDWYLSPGLALDILRNRRDLIHIHGINALVPPVAMLAAWLRRTPYIVTFHSGGAHTKLRERLRGTQWRLLGPLLRRAAALIAVSESERSTFQAIVGDRPIVVIPNGSLELPVPEGVTTDPNLLLSVGRLERYKGHHRVIEALPQLMLARPEVRLEVLGVGPYEPALRDLVREKGLGDRVVISSVPPEDRAGMAAKLASAAAVAALSDYEAHPVAVMEAVSLGCSVLARRNSGFVEMIDAGLISGIADDADDKEIAEGLDIAMSTVAEPIALPTWDECAAGIEQVYRRVLGLPAKTD